MYSLEYSGILYMFSYPILVSMACLLTRVVDPYSFFTDPDPAPDPELYVGGQYGSGSGSGSKSNTDPELK